MSNQDEKDALKGELVAFGADNYLHDPSKSLNYFVQIRQDNGTIKERWSKNLEDVIKDNGVQVGDTIVLTELGKEPIQVGDKTFNKTLWDLQRYEPLLDLPNTIEQDSEQEQQKVVAADNTKENEQDEDPKRIKKTPDLSEFEWQPPDNIKNNYVAIVKNRHLPDQKTNYYDKDDKQQVNIAFEDRNKSLHTSRQDEKTVYAMLDMAQAKGWTAISLKGTEEFKQKAWLEASLRGIEVKGYDPSEKDMAELKLKQTERTTNQVDMTAQKPLEPKQETEQNEKIVQEQTTPPTQEQAEQEKSQDEQYSNFQEIRNEYLEIIPEYYRSRSNGEDLSKYSEKLEDINKKLDIALKNNGDIDFENNPKKASLYEKLWDMKNNTIPEMQKDIEQAKKYKEEPSLIKPQDIKDTKEYVEHKIKDDYEQSGKNQVAIISQSLPNGDVRGYLWVAEEKSFAVGGFDQDDIMAFVEPYSKERALQYGIDEQKINRIEDMLKNGEIELYTKVVVEPTTEELQQLEANRQQWEKDQAERLTNQQDFDDKYFNNLPIEQREAILDDIQNSFEKNGVDWRFKAFESSRRNFDGTLASFGAGTWAIDVVRERIAGNEVQKPMSIKEHAEGNPQNNPENNLRIEIRQLFQNGYRDGLIKSRDDLVMLLKERGFEVKENQKSIRVTSIDGKNSMRLTNEVFTKLIDNIKELKDRLEPNNIKQNHPSLKDSNVVHITAYQNKITDDFKASNNKNPAVLQAQLQQLESGVKDMAQGKEMNLPNLPVNERTPNIEVRTTDNHDKSRQV